MKGAHGASKSVTHLSGLGIRAADRRDRALGKVCMKPRRRPKDAKDLSHRGEVVVVGVTKDDHVISVEKNARSHVPRGETPQDVALDGVL